MPKTRASVTAVLKPSLYEEQTNKSALATNLYGLSSNPNNTHVSLTPKASINA